MVRLLVISHKYGICSLFTGKCNFGVVPDGAITLSPTMEHLQLFQNKMTNAGRGGGGGGARLELTEPLNVGSTEVLCCFLENLTFPFIMCNSCVVGLQEKYRRTQVFYKETKDCYALQI